MPPDHDLPSRPDGPDAHVPVLLDEVLELLDPQPGQTFVDCTVGLGGHGAAIVPRLDPGGTYIGLDADAGNAATAEQRLRSVAPAGVTVRTAHANFVDAASVVAGLGGHAVDGLLADLGVASSQLDDPARGMTFQAQGPLDMRLDRSRGPTAAELVNAMPEQELADLIYQFGEERLSRRIARKIVEARQREPIHTTTGLARLVRQAYGRRPGRSRIDPATRTFMALRIAVNSELDSLQQMLAEVPGLLRAGARAAVISFHSLEDRLVKQAMRQWEQQGLGERINRKPLTAGQGEAWRNPRSRSAKLRAFRRHIAPAADAAGDGHGQTHARHGWTAHDARNKAEPADRHGGDPAGGDPHQ